MIVFIAGAIFAPAINQTKHFAFPEPKYASINVSEQYIKYVDWRI